MSQFPVDILSDILVRLPAKSLLRFKCVCKSWYHLINDPDFINRHVQRSNLHMIVITPQVYMSDFDTFDNPTPLNYPFKDFQFGGSLVMGSARGLLCFYMSSYPYTAFLYNPTTQSYKTLPFLPQMSTFDYPKGKVYRGFGYDELDEDYKVVKIFMRVTDNGGDLFKSQVMVYRLKSDYWKRGAHDVPYYFYCHRSHQVVVNGIFHWSTEGEHRVPLPIVGFNFNDETFSSVPLPNSRMEDYMRAHLGVLDSSLCVMLNYWENCELWLMKEYGVATSWTRLYSFPIMESCLQEMRPLCFSKCRKKLFVIYLFPKIVSLDLETLELTAIECPGFNRVIGAHVCIENLLMFKDSEDVHEGTQVQSRNTKRKLLMRNTERILRYNHTEMQALVNEIHSSNGES